MAAIDFYGGTWGVLPVSAGGSGLGFYGTIFGASVRVGEYQGTTYITNAAGTQQGAATNNIKWAHANSGYVNAASTPLAIQHVPNAEASLNCRFTHSTPVQVQNWQMWIYDRVNQYNTQSGVTVKAAETIHTNVSQGATSASGDSSWTTFNAGVTGTYLALSNSPGISGQYAGNGSNSVRPDTRHDTYILLSASPDSIGSKTQFGLLTSLEYL